MSNAYLEKLKAIMANPTEMAGDKLKSFVDETMQYFQELQESLKSGDAEAKAEALHKALEVKEHLEEQMKAISKMTGMTPEQLLAHAANSATLNEGEWKSIEEVRGKLLGAAQKEAPKSLKPALAIKS